MSLYLNIEKLDNLVTEILYGYVFNSNALITGISSTAKLKIGMLITKVSGEGVLTGTPSIVSIDSEHQITISTTSTTSGNIKLKYYGGENDKTIMLDTDNDIFELNQSINLPTGKTFQINHQEIGDGGGISPGGTITTATVHGLAVGDGVVVSGVTNVETGDYNGLQIVTGVADTTHFTYANTGGNESEIADTGGTIIQNMSGKVDGATSIQKSFDYDTNVQRGTGSDGEEAPITAVAIGLTTAQFVKATTTIIRSIANSVSIVAPLERNYSNP